MSTERSYTTPIGRLVPDMLLKIMGYSDSEADQLLDYLYPALAEEIEKLKTLMEG